MEDLTTLMEKEFMKLDEHLNNSILTPEQKASIIKSREGILSGLKDLNVDTIHETMKTLNLNINE